MRWFFTTLLLLAFFANSFSQIVEIRGGKTLLPGIFASARYEHFTNSELNLAGGVFHESSNKNNLRYRCAGIDLLGQYSSDREMESILSYKAGIGANLQIENEPWVYKEWNGSQRVNYGIIGEVAGVIHLTEAFDVSVFSQQKFFFNKKLGTTHFLFGIGLSYHFNQ